MANQFDLNADIQYRIEDIEALRTELNNGIDNAISRIKAGDNPEAVRQAHKSLLNGISWAVKEERDQQIERDTAQTAQMYK